MIDVNEQITLADVEGARNYSTYISDHTCWKECRVRTLLQHSQNEADWFVLNDSTVTQVKQPITNFIQSLAQF
jgi:hypothetical protein